MIKKSCLFLLIVLVFESCTVVKEYEKVKINDVDMKLAAERLKNTKQLSRFIGKLLLELMVENQVVDVVATN